VKVRVALLLLCAVMPVHAAPIAKDVEAYRMLVKQDLRLATVGFRLAAANAPFCKDRAPNAGWVLHDIAQYPDEATARSAFAFEHPVQVAAVVVGSPADRAGIDTGDHVIGLDNATLYWPAMPVGKTGYERMASFMQLVAERWKAGAGLSVELVRDGAVKNATLEATPICVSDFWVDSKAKLDAGADGEKVRVTSGLIAYTPADDELAAVVAHELSHNLLHHRERLDKVRKSKSKAVLETEIEADRLSVWLMANAGFDPNAAIRFWERYGRRTGLGIFSDSTHLRWKSRIKLLQAEIDLLANAEKQGGLRAPPLLGGG
jgi:beta-barrel assembly-enhancing protease